MVKSQWNGTAECPRCGGVVDGMGVEAGPSLADLDTYHEGCAK